MKFMKTVYSTLILLIAAFSVSVAQNWTELTKPVIVGSGSGYSSHDQAYAVCSDSQKNFFLTGYFEGIVVFHGDTLVSRGNRDIFIAKYDSTGTYKWSRSAGGASSDYGTAVACDSAGNIVIAGYFYETAYFGSNTITATANSDAYVAKLDASGNWLWAKAASGAGFEKANGISIDAGNNIYITGNYDNNIKFGSTTLTSSGFRDIFIAKINSAGNWIWARSGGSTSTDDGLAVAYSKNGNYLAVGGYVGGNATFGSIQVTSGGGRDFILAAMDTTGTFTWVKNGGGSGSEECRAATVDADGSIYVSGYFEQSITLGSTTLTSVNSRDIFVAKISKTGTWQWAQKAGATDNDEAFSILIDGQDCFVGGMFYKNCYFGTTDTLQSMGDRDGFVAKISISGGNWIWARSAQSASSVDIFALAIDGTRVGAAGSFYDTVTYGNQNIMSKGGADISFAFITRDGVWDKVYPYPGIVGYITSTSTAIGKDGSRYFAGSFYGQVKFGTTTLTSNGLMDIFVAKMKSNGAWEWAAYAGSTSDDGANSVSVDNNGNVFVAGLYNGQASFGNYSVSSAGLSDAFVAKLNSSGVWQWVKSAGYTNGDVANSIQCDRLGNAYVAGYFSTKAFFGTIQINAKGSDDIFVAKISTSGNWIWAKSAGSTSYDQANALALDSAGHIYVTGSFESTASFGSNNIISNGGDDIFIAKMDTSGTWFWARSAGNSNWQEHGSGVAVDSAGDVFFCGTFNGITSFGDDYKISNGLNDAFVAKLDSGGTWKWAESWGGSDNDEAVSITFDDSHTYYVGGNFGSAMTFHGKTITSVGLKDIFLITAHDSTTFALDTIQTAGSTNNETLTSIASDLHGRVLLTGYYLEKTAFGSLTLNEPYNLWKNSFFAINGYLGTNEFWSYADSTGKNSKIIIPKSINPKLGNRKLMDGDAVGVFFMRSNALHCAGYGIWHDSDLTITVWGDDANTLVKDGMADGETYTLKTWDAAFGVENIVNVRFGSGPDYFQNNAISTVSQFPIIYDTLKIPAKAGWNLFSSNIDPKPVLRTDSILMANKANIVLVKNISGKNWIPSFNIFNLGNWNVQEGYLGYLTKADTFKIIGIRVKPELTKIPLKYGWAYISYLRDSPMPSQIALANIVSNSSVVLVKNISGKTYIPDFNLNSLGDLKVGEAYQIFTRKTDTLIYPANGSSKLGAPEPSTPMPMHWIPEYNSTGNSMVVVISANYEDNTEIGAYDSQHTLIGSGTMVNGHASVVIWGDNGQTKEKEGAKTGDDLNFEALRTDGTIESLPNSMFKDLISGNVIDRINYSPEAIYMSSVKNPLAENEMRISPNPASDNVIIKFNLPDNSSVNSEIIDLKGEILQETGMKNYTSGEHTISMNVMDMLPGTYFVRLLINDTPIIKKINIVR